MTRQDVLLRILAAAEGDPLTPAQLQKVTFLVSEECKEALPDDFYEFENHHYGPLCLEIYRDAQALQSMGLAAIGLNDRGGWKEYAATYKGVVASETHEQNSIAVYIREKVSWAMKLSFQELVRAIYIQYPEYRENSAFQY